MRPIAIFYHTLFFIGKPPVYLSNASRIVLSQMSDLRESGLLEAAAEFHVGVNGDMESASAVKNFIPKKAVVSYHGLGSRSENHTIATLQVWAKEHPGWNVLYFHTKGATNQKPISEFWRQDMMLDLVTNWQRCVRDLEHHDIATSLWMWNQADGTQHIPAGNFLWATSDFIAKLPSIHLRERIKQDGLGAETSRWEAECYWGNGPRPNVISYRQQGWPWNHRETNLSTNQNSV